MRSPCGGEGLRGESHVARRPEKKSFAQWHREGVQSDRREQYPLTLGYVSYETLRRVGVVLGITLTLLLPGEYVPKQVAPGHHDDTNKNTPVSEQILTILSVAK